MIAMKELLSGSVLPDVPINHQHNLVELQRRINLIRKSWGKPMVVTSGYRSMYDHTRIYSEINAKRRRRGLPPVKMPMGSRHLSGEAVDIADPDGKLMEWCKANAELLEKAELWCEDGTVGWVHFQIKPPKSGKRFFLP